MNRNKGRTNVLRKDINRNGIPDRLFSPGGTSLFRHHGRWASKNATYVRDDINSRLSITQSLGT